LLEAGAFFFHDLWCKEEKDKDKEKRSRYREKSTVY